MKQSIEEAGVWADKITKKLDEAEKNGQDIAFAKMWVEQLRKSCVDKNWRYHNRAYIWFKNAQRQGGVFKEIFTDICHLSSYIYL